jgi:hypothetical protein
VTATHTLHAEAGTHTLHLETGTCTLSTPRQVPTLCTWRQVPTHCTGDGYPHTACGDRYPHTGLPDSFRLVLFPVVTPAIMTSCVMGCNAMQCAESQPTFRKDITLLSSGQKNGTGGQGEGRIVCPSANRRCVVVLTSHDTPCPSGPRAARTNRIVHARCVNCSGLHRACAGCDSLCSGLHRACAGCDGLCLMLTSLSRDSYGANVAVGVAGLCSTDGPSGASPAVC